MRRIAIVLVLVIAAAACSGGDADTTAVTPEPTVTTPPPTTTTTTVAPTTTTSSTSTTSTTTTTLPAGFVAYEHEFFSLSHPDAWGENPEFSGIGAGFVQDHIALALPSSTFDIYLEEQEAGFDLDAHVERIQDDLALFVADFRVLRSGDQSIDGVRSLWFEYAEDFDGFPIVRREQVALRDDLLVTFTLTSPEEFFEFDQPQTAAVIESFRFS